MESLFDIQKDIFDNIKEYFKKFKILKKCLEMKRFKLIKIIKLIGNKKFKFEMIYNSYIEKLSIFFLKLKNKKIQ
jgi:inorganic pyrophosphatase